MCGSAPITIAMTPIKLITRFQLGAADARFDHAMYEPVIKVSPGKGFKLSNCETKVKSFYKSKKHYHKRLDKGIEARSVGGPVAI
ncbi:hypothetical protein [Thiorhodovibrio frisius]|uniref:Uncharacterized protein n=1 Tax=Thiorhodovibrio frisius TaxID=631362 RepID=H8Z0Y6_9GAMM|nr:hypothetical protein [Thiorhodovibrio frisius]EIC22407.1 hypothetical protein Thi970DRAFT_02667 [Thiorhodovibrio frisius]WPL24706.1 hypothetical protein Thiofri_04926 [Thiorhodovibrio frisius]